LPKQPRLTALEAERMLLEAGYSLLREKGSHRIYRRGSKRVVVPFHPGKTLHPKITRQVLAALPLDS
jgi:predicted RNA binding protein YcfA (HicA-like mRNA interferase family)